MGSDVGDVKTYINTGDNKTQLKSALDKLKKRENLSSDDTKILEGLRKSAGFNNTASRKANSDSHYLETINQALKKEDSFKGYRVTSTYNTDKRLKLEGSVGNENCSDSLIYEDDWKLETPHKPKPKPKPHYKPSKPANPERKSRCKPSKPVITEPEKDCTPKVEEKPEKQPVKPKRTIAEEDTMNDLGSRLRGSASVREERDDDGPSPWLFALGAFGASLGNIAGCFGGGGGGCYTPQPCYGGGGGCSPFRIGPVYYTDGDTWPWGRTPPGINLGGGGYNFGCSGRSFSGV